jgi:hypothetical protein
MARDFVMPLDSRKKWLSWFFIYLVASSVVIAAVLHDVLREYSVCQAQRDALESREKRFFSWHPDYRTPGQCKVALQAKLMAALRDVEGLVEFESGKTSMAKILFGLAVALPQGVDLGAVDFEGTERKLNFEVLMTVRSKEEDKFSATSQVAAWEREPLLAGRLVQIEVENSERVKRDGMEMMCWRFSASVGEK